MNNLAKRIQTDYAVITYRENYRFADLSYFTCFIAVKMRQRCGAAA